jgi:hypothetical protein
MVFSDEALRIGEIVGGAVILPSLRHNECCRILALAASTAGGSDLTRPDILTPRSGTDHPAREGGCRSTSLDEAVSHPQ